MYKLIIVESITLTLQLDLIYHPLFSLLTFISLTVKGKHKYHAVVMFLICLCKITPDLYMKIFIYLD